MMLRGLGLIAILWGLVFIVSLPRETAREFRALPFGAATHRLERLAQATSAQNAWDYLKRSYLGAGGALLPGKADIHELAHIAGAQFFKRDGVSAISHCDSTFTYGCYHGFVGEMVLEDGASSIANVITACQHSARYDVCVHGAGHGIQQINASDFKKAVGLCEQFGDAASNCVDGVVMEQNRAMPRSMLTTRPWYPCDELPTRFQVACASTKPNDLIERKKTPQQIATFCESGPSGAAIQECLFMTGYAVLRLTTDPKEIADYCSLVPEAAHDQCLFGSADLIVNMRLGDWRASAAGLCAGIDDPHLRTRCGNEAKPAA